MPSINELELAKELIKFPTITPVDAGVMRFLEKKLKSLGFKTKILEFKEKNNKPVKNLYARLGTKGLNFCYAGHLDVVPPGDLKDWTVNPFKPIVKKGHLIGRGANDMKSSIAAFVAAVNNFINNNDFNGSISLLITGSVSYDATEKAFNIVSSSDIITTGTNIGGVSGDFLASVSLWFKPSTVSSSTNQVLFIHTSAYAIASSFVVSVYEGEILAGHGGTNYSYNNGSITQDNWYHVVAIKKGTGAVSNNIYGIYLNGTKLSLTNEGGTDVMNVGSSQAIIIGSARSSALNTEQFVGKISNVKYYPGVVLTAEEVAMEYALGRTGKSINLTDTALCLGGTVPRAQLDVRGGAVVGGNVGIGTTNPVATLNIQGLSKGTPPTSGGETTSNGLFRIRDNYNVALDIGTLGVSPWSTWLQVADATSMGGAFPLVLNPNGGNVGIGVTNPFSKLSLRPKTIYNGQTTSSFTTDMGGLELIAANTADARWNLTMHDNNDLYFLYTVTGTSGWGISGYLVDATNVANIDFTGQHRNFIHGVPYTEYDSLEGLIVSANKNKYYDINEDITTGANAIQISQSLPLVSLSSKEKDKACFGVISGSEDPESREYAQGSFVSVVQKQKGDRRAFINSVGEGAMWVVNTNGSLESGDYITTSNVAGYGQRQDDDILHNYTVAKITMDCDFEPVTQPIQIIKKELTNVNYWVKTTYSNVSLDEYSNLAEENRTTEDETYYTKDVERTFTYKPTVTVTVDDAWDDVSIFPSDVTYAEWSNLEANVQNTYTLTYTQNDYETMRYQKTTVSNVTAEDAWDAVHIEPPTVTYAEYSNLEANVQNTYTLTYTKSITTTTSPAYYSNLTPEEQNTYTVVYTKTVTENADADTEGADAHVRTIYKKIEREETKEERDDEEWVLDVRQELVNVLDEHGQLQWEDDPSGATEKAYKIRYLDAAGQQTDEASHVYTAAFVGVTYHCG